MLCNEWQKSFFKAFFQIQIRAQSLTSNVYCTFQTTVADCLLYKDLGSKFLNLNILEFVGDISLLTDKNISALAIVKSPFSSFHCLQLCTSFLGIKNYVAFFNNDLL